MRPKERSRIRYHVSPASILQVTAQEIRANSSTYIIRVTDCTTTPGHKVLTDKCGMRKTLIYVIIFHGKQNLNINFK